MASARKKEEPKGPKPYEVIIGAFLSIILGVLLAAVYLVSQPVEEVDELPPETQRDRRTVYFVEGRTGSALDFNWRPKATAFEEGVSGSIELVEEELNQWAAVTFPDLEDMESEGMLSIMPRSVNFRVDDDRLHIASNLEISVFGFGGEYLAQSRGNLVQRDGRYVFAPESLALGGFRVPHGGLIDLLVGRVLSAFDPPEELSEAWSRMSRAEVQGDRLIVELP
jgi:hypothetical protein